MTTKGLTEFGIWLLTNGYLGHGLLVIHGCQMGFKLKDQLELKWKDFINENGDVKEVVQAENDIERGINSFVETVTKEVLERLNPEYDLSLSPYLKKSGEEITNHNLKVELNRYLDRWNKEKKSKSKSFIIEVIGEPQKQPIRSQDLEHAWARDYLASKDYHIEAFKELSRAMKHRSLDHTIKLYGVTPIEPTPEYGFNFDYYLPNGFYKKILRQPFTIGRPKESKSNRALKKVLDEPKNDLIRKIREAK